MASEYRPEEFLPDELIEDEDSFEPVEPTVSDLATLRRAEIANQPLPQTTGPGDSSPWAAIKYGYGQESHTAQRAGAMQEAGSRFLMAGKEFLSAPGPWMMETLQNPTGDTPFTAMLGAAIEIASYTTAPVEEVFVQGVALAGEALGLSQEEIAQHKERAAMASGMIAGMLAGGPALERQQAKMLGQEAWMKSKPGQAAAGRQIAEGSYVPESDMPLSPAAPRTEAAILAAARERGVTGSTADSKPAGASSTLAGPATLPAATIAPRRNAGKWADLQVRQGYTGDGVEPVSVGMKNGRPALLLEDGTRIGEMTVEEAKAYREAGDAGKMADQADIRNDVAARMLAELDNPAARDSLDFPPITDEEFDAIEKITLLHGSPHLFDRFSTEKIGTGEGAQAYTHGLYQAESEGVARSYMQAGDAGVTLDGVSIGEIRVDAARRKHLPDAEMNALLELSEYRGDVDDLITQLEQRVETKFTWDPEDGGPVELEDARAEYGLWHKVSSDALDVLKKWRAEGRIKENKGHLYKTEIPKKAADDFLDLDLTLAEQSPKVRKAFEDLGVTDKARGELAEMAFQSLLKDIDRWSAEIDALKAEDLIDGTSNASEHAYRLELIESLSGKIRDALIRKDDAERIITAQDAYYSLANKLGKTHEYSDGPTRWSAVVADEKAASEALSKHGVKGAKYFDQGSRGAGQGTRNYVIYDDSIIEIIEIDGKPIKGKKAINEPELKAQLDARREAIEPDPMQREIDADILEERLALAEEGSVSLLSERLDAEAQAAGVDPMSGELLPTAEELAADARAAAERASKPKKGAKGSKRLDPSQEAFQQTYGGTSVGSGAAAAARTAKARAKYQRIFDQGPAEGNVRLYQTSGQTFTDDFELAARSQDPGKPPTVRFTDVSEAKAAKYKAGTGYTVPKTTADRSKIASVPRRQALGEAEPALALDEVELNLTGASVLDQLRPTEAAPQPVGEGPPVLPGEADVPRGTFLQRSPAIGVELPIRATSVSDNILPIDTVADQQGNKWTVMEVNPDGTVKVNRVLERGEDGVILKSEEQLFHRDELTTEMPVYDPERGASAVRLSDGTVVVGSRYTHNSAAVETKASGLGHLITNNADDFGHVIGEDQRYVTPDEFEGYKRAKKQAEAEADTPVDVDGDPGAAPPNWRGQEGFLMIERKSREQRAWNKIKSRVKGWRSIIGDHGLKFTQHAAPDALDAINHSVGARGGSKFYVAQYLTQPIDRALGKVGAHERVLTALRDSNIQGAKERWFAYAEQIAELTDDEVMELADNYWRDWYNLAVDHLNVKDGKLHKGMLTRNINEGNVANVRSLMKSMFQKAGESIGPMPESSAAFIKTDEFWKAIEAAGEFFENLKQWNEDVGGHETHFTGPAKTYIPLTPFDASMEARPFGGTRLPFRRMRPGTTMHRTGLSGQYDASVEALARRVSSSHKAIGRNDAIKALEESGVGVRMKPGQKPPEQLFAVAGVPEEVVVFETTKERIVTDAKGKMSKVPPERIALPKSIADELKPIFEAGRMDDIEAIERIQNAVIDTFLRGIAEPAIHGQNVVSFLGKATGEFFPQAMYRIFKTKMNSPEAIRQLQWMAEHGSLPNRYASVTYSKELAKQYGAELLQPFKPGAKGFASGSAVLYGPNGIDIRARVAAAIYFDDMVAAGHISKVTNLDKFRFLDQLGHYQAQTRTAFQKKVTVPYVQPFFTAATSRMRAALEVWGLAENSSGRQGLDLVKLRLRQQVTQGVVGGTAAWFIGHRVVTGKWPWEDRNAKFMQIPVPREWAQSPTGRLFIKEDDRTKQAYIGLGGLFPVGYTMMRLTGAQAAINVGLRGGNAAQQREAALSQTLATVAQQFVGPSLHVIFAMAPELSPDILRFGRRGTGPLSFASQDRDKKPGPGLDILDRLKAGGHELGQIGEIGAGLLDIALSDEKSRERKAKGAVPATIKALTNLLLKQALAAPEDVRATRERLRRERQRR